MVGDSRCAGDAVSCAVPSLDLLSHPYGSIVIVVAVVVIFFRLHMALVVGY